MTFPRQITSLLFALLAIALADSAAGDEIVSRIRRHPVQSSSVASAGYSRQLRALEIEFRRGAVYRFLDVPSEVDRAFRAANSKGGFIAKQIRGHYRFVRVRPPPRRGHSESPPA